jgi:hypothetical protein
VCGLKEVKIARKCRPLGFCVLHSNAQRLSQMTRPSGRLCVTAQRQRVLRTLTLISRIWRHFVFFHLFQSINWLETLSNEQRPPVQTVTSKFHTITILILQPSDIFTARFTTENSAFCRHSLLMYPSVSVIIIINISDRIITGLVAEGGKAGAQDGQSLSD